MSTLIYGTSAVSADEPAFNLKEINMNAPDSRGFRRYRILQVVPNARLQAGEIQVHAKHLREFRQDLGPANLFTGEEFNIVGGGPLEGGGGMVFIVETVGRLVEMAERIHAGYLAPVERPEPSDLIGMYHDQQDKKRKNRRRVSTFGYGKALQRSS